MEFRMQGWRAVLVAAMGLLVWRSAAKAEDGPAVVLTSPNAKLELHSSIHLDYMSYDKEEMTMAGVTGSMENNFSARRARLGVKAKVYENIGFYLQAAFDAPGSAFMIDAQLSMAAAPWMELTAGLMKLPFSEERLKGYATRQPFLERSLAANLEIRRSQGAQVRFHVPDSDAVSLYLGCFTGETLVTPNTDDHFEYVGRTVFRLDRIFDGWPGYASVGGSYAFGLRLPERTAVTSFSGKTMNGVVFFSPVPVSGARTRYEADFEWRVGPVALGGEYIKSIEERDQVTVNLRTPLGPDTVTRDLEPLTETGWNVFLVWVITGEEAKAKVEPSREWGAVSAAVRYSTITFDAGDHKIASSTPGVHGHEINATAAALGRPGIDETMNELYAGLTWDLHQGVFFQGAAVWQWWDRSSPFVNGPDKDYDLNYRARLGVTF